jgi:hypothetical protein
LRFKYRVIGKRGSAIIVTTQHRQLELGTSGDDDFTDEQTHEIGDELIADADNDYDEWTRPTEHAKFGSVRDYIST